MHPVRKKEQINFKVSAESDLFMKKESVPQERGIIPEGDRVLYATNQEGEFELVKSAGEECVNVANEQAWEQVEARCAQAKEKILQGKASPLLYHLEKQQLDSGMFASMVHRSRLTIFWHLKPGPFAKLDPATLAQYAKALRISVEELTHPFEPQTKA